MTSKSATIDNKNVFKISKSRDFILIPHLFTARLLRIAATRYARVAATASSAVAAAAAAAAAAVRCGRCLSQRSLPLLKHTLAGYATRSDCSTLWRAAVLQLLKQTVAVAGAGAHCSSCSIGSAL